MAKPLIELCLFVQQTEPIGFSFLCCEHDCGERRGNEDVSVWLSRTVSALSGVYVNAYIYIYFIFAFVYIYALVVEDMDT